MAFQKKIHEHLIGMKIKLVKKILLLNILGGTLCSCGLKQINSEYPIVNEISVHERFRINLPEEHSSGYIWQLSENFDEKIIDNFNTVWHGHAKGVDFNFNTIATGQTTLSFVLRKHTDTSEIKHFIVNISNK